MLSKTKTAPANLGRGDSFYTLEILEVAHGLVYGLHGRSSRSIVAAVPALGCGAAGVLVALAAYRLVYL